MPRVVGTPIRVLKTPVRFPGQNTVLAVAVSVGASVALFYLQTFALAAIIGTYLGVFTMICTWPDPFVNYALTAAVTPFFGMFTRTWFLLGALLRLAFMLNAGARCFGSGDSARGIFVLIATATVFVMRETLPEC